MVGSSKWGEGARKMRLLWSRSDIVLHCGVNVKECNQRDGVGAMEDGLVDYLEDEGGDGTDGFKSTVTIFDITAVNQSKKLLPAQGGHIQIVGVQSWTSGKSKYCVMS